MSPEDGWPFSMSEPPADMKELAVEMQQLFVSLAEAGFNPGQVNELVNYQLVVGLIMLRKGGR